MPLKANSAGKITGSFMIPAGVPVGTRQVVFEGQGGSRASAQYTGYGFRDIETRQQVITTTVYWVDPVAQSFQLPADRFVSGIDLWMTKIGDRTKPVIVQIRTLDSVPTNEILAETRLSGNDLKTNQWLAFNFDNLVFLESTKAYAVMVATDDPDHSLAVAVLGGFDETIQQKILSNPFPGGTFFDGGDSRSWVVKPDRALTMRIRSPRFTATEKIIELGTLSVTKISDIYPFVLSLRPERTDIDIEIKTPDNQIYQISPGSNLELPGYVTGNVAISLRLRGTATLSPVLMQPDIQVILGAIAEEATYISRAMAAGTDSRVTIVTDAYLQSGASVQVDVQTKETGGNITWTKLPAPKVVALGDGINELEYSLAPLNADLTRFRLTLRGGPASRPWLRGLRGVVTPNV